MDLEIEITSDEYYALLRASLHIFVMRCFAQLNPGTTFMHNWHTELVADRLTTTGQGFRLATSVGGVLTGRGADLIIIDDPAKPDEAISESHRRTLNNWLAIGFS
jgi:hypothetical protein